MAEPEPSVCTAAEGKVEVYVWDLPVRLTHWVNVASILVLSLTSYYIANPFILTHGIATNEFLMGTVRFVHFLTAFVSVCGSAASCPRRWCSWWMVARWSC